MKSVNKWLCFLCFSVVTLSACSGGGGSVEDLLEKPMPVEASNVYTANGVSFKMIRVEGGTFMMGATPEQVDDALDTEKPAHSVTLNDYNIGETEVTQELWEAVMGSNPSIFLSNAYYPVENVSWDDCQEFIRKLNVLLPGNNFRLPTEAEWEYAARGGNKSRGYKYAGSNTIYNVAWYGDCGHPHDVAGKTANELGLFDMSGNVREWCFDLYGNYSSDVKINPTGPSTGSYRVCRGGGWTTNAEICRVSTRSFHAPDFYSMSLGFRLAL